MRIKNCKFRKGFSLVELIVAVAITALIMLGISAFFSNGFQQMFMAQKATASTLSQLTFSSVLQKQFIKANSLYALADDGKFAILKNDPEKTKFNFSYLGEKEGQIEVKDFFVFNGYEGSKSSQDFAELIAHPAGITMLGGKYYVAAPLENAIYQCTQSCEKMVIDDLKHPMDLATDGSHLFLTDAGNDRVLQIENVGGTNDVTVMISELNFPTGIEYYPGGKGYLFVADTYNHAIKKIQIEGDAVSTVVGKGTNEECNNTAEFCQLSYPTGLALGNDGSGDALYIADTGNNRLLKMLKPDNLTEFELNVTSPDEAVAVKEIKVVFPINTKLNDNSLSALTSDNNALNPNGTLVVSDNVLTYQLWTELDSDTESINTCDPEPCIPPKNKISVLNPDLFNPNKYNQLKLGELVNNFTVSAKTGATLSLSPNFPQHQEAETEVVLTSTIPAKTGLTFNFSNVDAKAVQGGFKSVTVQFYGVEDNFLKSEKVFFRFPGEELGSSDDLIAVHAKGVNHPTGLGWSGNTLIFAEKPVYPSDFGDVDYTTDFTVEDFNLTSKNEEKLLELSYKILKNTESEEEEKGYENHVINAALNP